MARRYSRCDYLTRHFYESSEHQRRINEIHQQHNKNEADLPGECDHEAVELDNADFPPLNGSDAIPLVPAQVPTGTQTWLQVVKGESSAVNSDLDAGQVSAIESFSTSTTMSISGLKPYSEYNIWNPNPFSPLTLHELCRAYPLLKDALEQNKNCTSSNADERYKYPARTNADEKFEDPASADAAAANSDLDVDQVSVKIESTSTSSEHSTMSTDPIIYLTSHEPYRDVLSDASDSDPDVQISDAKLLQPSIKEESLNRSPAHDSSFQQSEDLQRGNISSSLKEALVFFCLLLLIFFTLKFHAHGVQ